MKYRITGCDLECPHFFPIGSEVTLHGFANTVYDEDTEGNVFENNEGMIQYVFWHNVEDVE